MDELNYLLDACYIRDMVEEGRVLKISQDSFFHDIDNKAHFYVSSWTVLELMNEKKEQRQKVWSLLSSANASIVFFGDGAEANKKTTFRKLCHMTDSYFQRTKSELFEIGKKQKEEMILESCGLIGAIFAWLFITNDKARSIDQFPFVLPPQGEFVLEGFKQVNGMMDSLYSNSSRKGDTPDLTKIIAISVSLSLRTYSSYSDSESNQETRYIHLINRLNSMPDNEKGYADILKTTCKKLSLSNATVFAFIEKSLNVSRDKYSQLLLDLLLAEKLFKDDRFPKINDFADLGLIMLVENCLNRVRKAKKMLILTSDKTLIEFINELDELDLMKESYSAISKYVNIPNKKSS